MHGRRPLGRGAARRHGARHDRGGAHDPPRHRPVRAGRHPGPCAGRRRGAAHRRRARHRRDRGRRPRGRRAGGRATGARSPRATQSAPSPRPGPDGLPTHVHVQRVAEPGLEAPRRAVPSLAGGVALGCAPTRPRSSAWSPASPPPRPTTRPRSSPAATRCWPRPRSTTSTRRRGSSAAGGTTSSTPAAGPASTSSTTSRSSGTATRRSRPPSRASSGCSTRTPASCTSRWWRSPRRSPPASRRRSTPCSSSTRARSRSSSRSGSRGRRPGNEDVIAIRGAYHGWTVATDAITTSVLDNPRALETRPAWAHAVEAPNPLRGRFAGPDAGSRYAEDVRRVVAELAGRRPRPGRVHRRGAVRQRGRHRAAGRVPARGLRRRAGRGRARRRGRGPGGLRAARGVPLGVRAAGRRAGHRDRGQGGGQRHGGRGRDHDPRHRRRVRCPGLVLLVGRRLAGGAARPASRSCGRSTRRGSRRTRG